jgi:hypothetical protein
MSTLEQYKEYFKPAQVPAALVKLLEFAEAQKGWFSQGFEMDGSYFSGGGLKTYSTDPDFIKCFREIAQADGTGSTYAIWSQTGDWDNAPIIAFGSEGGVQVVAENLLGLFRILTLDAEPMISFDRITYFKEKDSSPSDGSADYANWLKKTFKLTPVADDDEVERIVNEAQSVHKMVFDGWMKKYCAS